MMDTQEQALVKQLLNLKEVDEPVRLLTDMGLSDDQCAVITEFLGIDADSKEYTAYYLALVELSHVLMKEENALLKRFGFYLNGGGEMLRRLCLVFESPFPKFGDIDDTLVSLAKANTGIEVAEGTPAAELKRDFSNIIANLQSGSEDSLGKVQAAYTELNTLCEHIVSKSDDFPGIYTYANRWINKRKLGTHSVAIAAGKKAEDSTASLGLGWGGCTVS